MFAHAQTRTVKPLDIYFVDLEGGNGTLLVSPQGSPSLSNTGNPGAAAPRDADRVAVAANNAHLLPIDHLVTTHWHGDHFGGMAELVKRIPIREFIDHAPNVQPAAATEAFLSLHDTRLPLNPASDAAQYHFFVTRPRIPRFSRVFKLRARFRYGR